MKNNRTTDPRWQKKRLEIFQRDGFTCQRCYNDKEQIEAHHLIYIPGIAYHDYPSEFLITLCRSCHQHETENIEGAIQKLVLHIKTSGLLSDEINDLATYYGEKRRRLTHV